MSWSFTAAAERALAEAAGWSSRADRDELDAPELLMGLLAEEECRAAQMLLSRGVNTATVSLHWPELHRNGNGGRRDFSPAVATAIDAAIDRLWAYPRPLHLATEHLLLGLASAPGEAADWLALHGLRADELEAQIHTLYGHEPGPVSLEPPVDIEEAGAERGRKTGRMGSKKKIPGCGKTLRQTACRRCAHPSPYPFPWRGEGIRWRCCA